MGTHGEIHNDNIIKATMEELTEEERKAYLIAEEHLKEQFLQGFKKERGGLVKRVGEFVMPSFKLNQDKVEVLPNDPSELVRQFSLMVDSKISAAQVASGETLAGLNDEIAALKKGKTVEGGAQFTESDSAGTSFTQDQFYGMPPNSFPGQSPLPSTVHTPPVPPVTSTGQTGAGGQTGYSTGQTGMTGQQPVPSVPYTSNPSSAVPSRTNEMVMYTGPHATSQQGSGPHRGPISNTNMAYSGPTMQRVSSSPNTSASGAYQADFSRFKEDLAGVLKSKLGIDMGGSRLYQKPYPPEFDFISYPVGWHIPEFVKFNGEDSRTTWEHVSQYVLQLEEACLNDALRVRLFSLSLTGTAFSWFSSLAPGSILNWNQLERKFHDHFYSGEAEIRLLDLTSIKQNRDESVLDYFQRFKALKNWCFNSSLSEKDLADLAFNGLHSYLKEKLEGFDYITINHLQMRAIGTEFKYKNSKDTFKPHRSNTHVLDHDSDSSDDDSKEVYAAEFVWPSKAKPGSVPSLKPIQKNRQEELKFTFDVSKCDRIFDELLKNGNI